MAGYMIYGSKEYFDKLLGKNETVSVVYGGYSTQLRDLKAVSKNDET